MDDLLDAIKGDDYSKELDIVHKTLKYAGEYGLECEVILTALRCMKNHPELSIEEALDLGIEDWDI